MYISGALIKWNMYKEHIKWNNNQIEIMSKETHM